MAESLSESVVSDDIRDHREIVLILQEAMMSQANADGDPYHPHHVYYSSAESLLYRLRRYLDIRIKSKP
jgi:hypothetical protein